MGLVLLEGPAAPVVSLEEAQAARRIDSPEETSLLQTFVAAATLAAEAYCRRRFVTQRWRATYDAFPARAIRLDYPPLVSVEAVTYVDTAGAVQTLAPADYVVRPAETPGEIVRAWGKSWPSTQEVPDAVTVDFTCGYGDPADVPEAIRTAIVQLVGTYDANRESVAPVAMQPIPQTVEWLLGPYRVLRFAP